MGDPFVNIDHIWKGARIEDRGSRDVKGPRNPRMGTEGEGEE
jgi:hypothetical protein